MPLINGQKMACEPCIRGHRSTKCTHAKERLMVPVRKPGRPLSSCPHPPNRNCGCAGVTAAIPRKQTCVCGSGPFAEISTSYDAPLPLLPHHPPAPSPVAPTPASPDGRLMSPTRSTFRVQKPTSSASRKASADPGTLDRMDPSQINIIHSSSPYTPIHLPHHYHPTHPPAPPQSFPYMPAGLGPFPPRPGPPYNTAQAPQLQPPTLEYMVPAPSHLPQNGSAPVIISIPPNLSASTARSCCSQPPSVSPHGSNDTRTEVPSTAVTTTMAKGVDNIDSPVTLKHEHETGLDSRGCGGLDGGDGNCNGDGDGDGNKDDNGNSNKDGDGNGDGDGARDKGGDGAQRGQGGGSDQPPSQAGVGVANGTTRRISTPAAMPRFPPTMHLFPQFYPPQPTVYTYPPMYGTYLHPLQPSQWKEAIATVGYGSQQPAPPISLTSYTAPATAPVPAPAAEAFPASPSSTGTTHRCSCGDGCQCVGCAAHPYNAATQRYVRSAWNSITDGGSGGLPATPTDTYQNGTKPLGSPNGVQALCPPVEGGSPPAAQTPSDTASNDEQALSASDFFFVTYPFAGEGCGGDTASCPCGDDCQCLGCTIHNNPVNAALPG